MTHPRSGFLTSSGGGGGGAGDVTGPASSTDNALARFDGTTGKIIQDSAGILTDAGALSGVTMNANVITAGTLAHERGGLEADVSAYSGLVKISGGATSQAVAGTDYAAAGNLGGNAADTFLIYTDFGGTINPLFENASGTGAGGSVNTVDDTGGHPGIVQFTTGTSTTGKYTLLSGHANSFLLGNGEAIFETCIRLPTASNGTDTYEAWLGFFDSGVPPTDAIYFRYTHTENSGNWVFAARNNGSETVVNTALAAANNTWQKLRVVVNAGATSAEGFVDGVSIGTLTALPSGAGRQTGCRAYLAKSAGTTARVMDMDYYLNKITLTSSR